MIATVRVDLTLYRPPKIDTSVFVTVSVPMADDFSDMGLAEHEATLVAMNIAIVTNPQAIMPVGCEIMEVEY